MLIVFDAYLEYDMIERAPESIEKKQRNYYIKSIDQHKIGIKRLEGMLVLLTGK